MSIATISHFCALGSGVLRNVQCVGPSPWYGPLLEQVLDKKRCFAVYVLHGKSEKVSDCVCCVLEQFNRKCHCRHFDLFCGVCAFFRHS